MFVGGRIFGDTENLYSYYSAGLAGVNCYTPISDVGTKNMTSAGYVGFT